jgi:hypothetical protein
LVVFSIQLSAQSQNGTGPKEKTVRAEMRSEKKARKKAREQRKLDKAERKAVEAHHKRIQSKAVRKRMKSSRKTAIRNHDNKREFFAVRWFKKKNNGRVKAKKKD